MKHIRVDPQLPAMTCKNAFSLVSAAMPMRRLTRVTRVAQVFCAPMCARTGERAAPETDR
jgi:hypothetical protein